MQGPHMYVGITNVHKGVPFESSTEWVVMKKFGEFIIVRSRVMDTHIHNGVSLQNNQENTIPMFARDVHSFLHNARKEHPSKTKLISYGEFVYYHSPLHDIGFVLFWFVKTYNLHAQETSHS